MRVGRYRNGIKRTKKKGKECEKEKAGVMIKSWRKGQKIKRPDFFSRPHLPGKGSRKRREM
jgi:hypothetical protein